MEAMEAQSLSSFEEHGIDSASNHNRRGQRDDDSKSEHNESEPPQNHNDHKDSVGSDSAQHLDGKSSGTPKHEKEPKRRSLRTKKAQQLTGDEDTARERTATPKGSRPSASGTMDIVLSPRMVNVSGRRRKRRHTASRVSPDNFDKTHSEHRQSNQENDDDAKSNDLGNTRSSKSARTSKRDVVKRRARKRVRGSRSSRSSRNKSEDDTDSEPPAKRRKIDRSTHSERVLAVTPKKRTRSSRSRKVFTPKASPKRRLARGKTVSVRLRQSWYSGRIAKTNVWPKDGTAVEHVVIKYEGPEFAKTKKLREIALPRDSKEFRVLSNRRNSVGSNWNKSSRKKK